MASTSPIVPELPIIRTRREGEQRATFFELFFDLVYVFAVTQLSHHLLDHLSWATAAETAFMLVALYWAWNYTTWMTNWFDPDTVPVRLVLVFVMLASLLMAVAIPEGFGEHALLFACAYSGLQIGRNAFVVVVTPRGRFNQNFRQILAWSVLSAPLWVAGGVVDADGLRWALWLGALGLDLAAPLAAYWLPRLGRTPMSQWQIEGAHFGERFQLFVIIALGESVVLAGATASDTGLSIEVVAALLLAFLSSTALWWLYFGQVAGTVWERIRMATLEERGQIGRDIYTYLHLPIVAGIVLVAVADELVIAHPADNLEGAGALVALGGPALFLAGLMVAAARTGHAQSRPRAAAVVALLAAVPLAAGASGLLVSALLAALLAVLVVAEQLRAGRASLPVVMCSHCRSIPGGRMAPETTTAVTSFSKALTLGEIHEDIVFPYPLPDDEEGDRVRTLIAGFREYAAQHLDQFAIDREAWIPEDVFRDLGDMGLMGLYVAEEYGGAGLSQTGYARVFEAFGEGGGSLGVALGVHQSIGMKGISMFGTDEQKQRFLPDLCAGRKLAAFALTEPKAGSDAFDLESRAVQQRDGSWLLNGEKRFIGNGGRGSVFVTFARTEIGGKDRHTAFILERGADGFEAGDRYDTMGLRGNDLRPLYFRDVRVPAENVLGEPGDGFRIAMQVLNNGRLSLGTSCVGLAKQLLDLAIDHVKERRQFGRPLADFDMVEDKIGWMVSHLFGLESTCYLTTGLVDAGMADYSIESAICKVAGTEFVWYQANRAMQLKGGEGYLRTEPYELTMRDIRIFPIFEGANDVLRSFIALSALKPLGDELKMLADADLSEPLRLLGAWAEYVVARVQREVRPDRLTRAHQTLAPLADPITEQVQRLREVGEGLLRRYRGGITDKGMHHKRFAAALADIYAQVAVLSRVTSIFEAQGVEASGQERYIAETFCTRAARRVKLELDKIEHNDDERMHSIARLAYKRGAYGYALFED